MMDKDKIAQAAKLIAEVYEYSAVGGAAHIVVDDDNLETHNIQWCLNVAVSKNLGEAGVDELNAVRKCLNALLGLTMRERIAALNLYRSREVQP